MYKCQTLNKVDDIKKFIRKRKESGITTPSEQITTDKRRKELNANKETESWHTNEKIVET